MYICWGNSLYLVQGRLNAAFGRTNAYLPTLNMPRLCSVSIARLDKASGHTWPHFGRCSFDQLNDFYVRTDAFGSNEGTNLHFSPYFSIVLGLSSDLITVVCLTHLPEELCASNIPSKWPDMHIDIHHTHACMSRMSHIGDDIIINIFRSIELDSLVSWPPVDHV